MSRNVYSAIYLHIVWRTKDNAPTLVDVVEQRSHHFLKHRALQSPGVIVHALNGTADHIHLAVTVPPTLLISEWIGQLKGATAYFINHEIARRKLLDWQTGYGVVSFGAKALPWVIQYVTRQKEHHAHRAVLPGLERVDADAPIGHSIEAGARHSAPGIHSSRANRNAPLAASAHT